MNSSKLDTDPAGFVSASAYEMARMTLELRRRRSNHFPCEIFGEPAWDALLVLFVEDRSNRGISEAAIAESIGIPQSTTSRWLAILESSSLVHRKTNDNPEPVFVMAPLGRQSMIDLFTI